MLNQIFIEGYVNSEVARKISHINKPYANFSIKVVPEDNPPFYCRCFISGLNYKEMNGIVKGDKIRIKGSIHSTLLHDGTYGKQIEVSKVEKLEE